MVCTRWRLVGVREEELLLIYLFIDGGSCISAERDNLWDLNPPFVNPMSYSLELNPPFSRFWSPRVSSMKAGLVFCLLRWKLEKSLLRFYLFSCDFSDLSLLFDHRGMLEKFWIETYAKFEASKLCMSFIASGVYLSSTVMRESSFLMNLS
jgi:hypothetical protein